MKNKYLGIFENELYGNILPFWMKHSPDWKYGGYFTCLDRKGRVYDDRKYMWLLGRMVWMFSKLYNTVEKKKEWLRLAKLGADFMMKHGKAPDGRIYFSLTRDGRPYSMQRKIFSECFYALGLGEYAKAAGDKIIYNDALDIFRKTVELSRNPSKLGRPRLSGQEQTSSLAVPMILLNLAEELETPENSGYFAKIRKECVKEIRMHIRPEMKVVLETVQADGKFIDTTEGRLVNPGHAIEAGWFLIHHALKENDRELIKLGQNMIDWSFDIGWDKKYGGIYQFLAINGHVPVQPEWNMKYFWPVAEASYASLLLYSLTGRKKYFDRFRKVSDYALGHFSDPEYGGWFGYLDRQGERVYGLKGTPYKAFFHIPRFLLYSINLLKQGAEK